MADSVEQEAVSKKDTLREIDWLSIAPWLLFARVPGATIFSSSLLLAMLGVFIAGGVPAVQPATPANLPGLVEAAVEGTTSLPRLFAGPLLAPFCGVSDSCQACGCSCGLWPLLVWSFIGLAIADRAARILTFGPTDGNKLSVMRMWRRWLRLAGALGLAIVPVSLLLYLLPKIAHGGLASDFSALAFPAAILWGMVLLASLFGSVLLAGVAIGLPLLWPAVAVDNSDPFEAVSRMLAYVFQRIPRLVFYVAIAAIGSIATGVLVELLTSTTLSITHLAFPEEPSATITSAQSIANWWETIFIQAMRAFYPAYFFAATVAIYLLLRRDIDGQPTDEMS